MNLSTPATATVSRRWLAFAVLLAGAFLPPLDFFIVNVALPSIRQGLGATPAQIEWVISAYAATYAVFLITGGRLGDLLGRRRVFLAGMTGFGMASLVCGLATSPSLLIVGRVLQGLSAAAMAPQGLASIHVLFPEHERSRALAVYGAALGFAAVIAQVLGGVLIAADVFGLQWRIIFLINLPIVATVFLVGIPFLPDTRSATPVSVDRLGVLLCALTLGLLVVPLVQGRELGWPWWLCLMLLSAPVVAVGLWCHEVALQRRGGTPLLSPQLASSPRLLAGLVSALFFYVVSAFFLTFSVYLQDALGATPVVTGLMFVPFGVGSLIGPLTTPAAVRCFGRWVPALGMLLEVLGCLILSVAVGAAAAGERPALALMITGVGLLGFGQGWALPTLIRSMLDRAPAGGSGMVSGLANSALQTSAALGVAVLGGLFYAVAAPAYSPATVAHGFIAALMGIALSLSLSALLALYASVPRSKSL
ncbi:MULTISPECIES: MFS transporter [unclassified Pseudomonas]|uniref:MFS transporter n=1 Tax=unclassified Pseudomonas TaxID=196821 RepID=UPI000B3FD7AC|nr:MULTISPECIES: MFS transporter [unclassified Pseudomonas]NVZ16848.1 MFS transporter [Pseudomonas sp. IPO3775]NWA75513.1 MFS transporter [Pseudomonas sp. C8002]NWC67308.1 MFS transporter [Pseudomonas sp. P7758]